MRLLANRERDARRRATESAEEREARLAANRERDARRRATESAEEREGRLGANREHDARRRATESAAERKIRLEANRQRNAASHACEDKQVQMQRLQLNQERVTRARAAETPQERTAKLEADRVRHEQLRLRNFANMQRAAVADSTNYMNRPQTHYLGPMIMKCQFDFCKAMHFFAENDTENLLHSCCHNGKILAPPLSKYPVEMKDLLTGDNQASRNFREHIRQYNNANAFASFGATNVAIPGHGPYCFKISGEVHHLATSALVETPEQPAGARMPKYGQLFVYDPQAAVNYRMSRQENAACDRLIMETIDRTMRAVSPYAHQYRRLHQVTQEEERRARKLGIKPRNFELCLLQNPRDDQRRYNEPTTNKECMYLVESGSGEIPLSIWPFTRPVHEDAKESTRAVATSIRLCFLYCFRSGMLDITSTCRTH